MKDQTTERRTRRRVPVGVSVKVRKPGGTEQEGLARDLSSAGIFLYSESDLEVGAKLELVITLPPGLGLGTGGWALCQASVVRVEEATGKGVGVAAVFDRIELLPELT
jgi:PilZ domain